MHPTERADEPGGLAERLFRMRKAARLTGGQLASKSRLGSRTKVSKIENGKQPPRGRIRAWAEACGHPEAARELLDLLADVQPSTTRGGGGSATASRSPGRLRPPHPGGEADPQRGSPLVIPGLLQTAGYARAIMTQVADLWGTNDIDATVEARMRRQEVLYDQSKTFEFVITEAALRMLPCPPQVMLGQLDRLHEHGPATT